MSSEPEIRSVIEDVLRNNPVVLFMKGTRAQPQCGFSAKTVAALDLLVPDYLDINVLEHPELREGIKQYGNWPTIPQVYVGGELLGGCDIVLEMLESGELAEALGVAAPEVSTPRIEIAASVLDRMRGALEQQSGKGIHLRIDAGWHHQLSLGEVTGTECRISCDGVDLHMDRWTASRADGLRISADESLAGTRFRFDNPNAPPPVQSMSARTLKEKLDRQEPLHLIDVRGPDERKAAVISGARPWNEETDRHLSTLPKDTLLVFHCHKGGRSQQAAEYMRSRGFTNVHNLAGGIDAWSREVDTSVPRY
jgi:monothiol glutaredoxin